eukprot:CAMPEP_0185748116 /NCGR_PEP_ID=MMETSP1174-20130828/6777_1 /TAXON_ID=35687 /ORGANISM="Dictyocha speculum, Strain CCMP1381" /LENGTH=165 /DNA_ID=CAMNT_0028423623 /DNA_START=26 /DNA_END=524 /DNA_ORIENTATION=-
MAWLKNEVRHWGKIVVLLQREEEKLAEEEEAANHDKAGGSNNDCEGGPDEEMEHLPTAAKGSENDESTGKANGSEKGIEEHFPAVVEEQKNDESTEEADGSEKCSEESLDEKMGDLQEIARLKKVKDSALEALHAAEKKTRAIAEQVTTQVNALCENLQERDEKV